MQFTSPSNFSIECHPRPLNDEEKHAFILWLQLEHIYELEGTNSVDTYAEVEQSLNSSYVAVFENGHNDFSGNLIAVITPSSIEMYTFAQNGEFTHKGTYEQA